MNYYRFYRFIEKNVRGGASCSENSDNNLGTIPSGPVALWISYVFSNLVTSGTVKILHVSKGNVSHISGKSLVIFFH